MNSNASRPNMPMTTNKLSGYAGAVWSAAWISGCALGSGSVPPVEVPGALFTKAGTFDLSPAATTASFTVAVVELIKVTGEFKQTSGRLVLGAQGKPQKVEVEMKSASADAGSDWLNDMLLGPRFFHATQHPTVVFRAEKFALDGGKLSEVSGDLTLRGITRPVKLKVNRFDCRSAAVDAEDKRARCIADASTQVKRTDFDMKSWMDSVSEAIRIDIKFTAFANP